MRIHVGCVLAIVFALVASRPALAQGIAGDAGPLVSPINTRNLAQYGSLLGLDRDQKDLARSLFQGYRAELRQAMHDANEKAKALNEDLERDANAPVANDPDAFAARQRARMKLVQEFVDRADGLERAFFADLRVLLHPEQAERMPAVERARQREMGLRFSILPGEGVDLVDVLDDMKIDRPGPEATQALNDYELEVDKLVRAKQAFFRDLFRKVMEMGEPDDPEMIEDMMGKFFEHGTRLRDANRKHARLIGALLPEDRRTPFAREVQKRSFPRVYAETAASKGIQAVRGFADLTPDQKTELDALAESFDRDAAALNDKWAAALEARMEELPGRFMEMMMAGEEGDESDPLAQAVRAREALDERIAKRLEQLATPEQAERLKGLGIEPSEFSSSFMPDFDLDEEAWEELEKEGGGG